MDKKTRFRAAFAVVRHLHDNPENTVARYVSGTEFIPKRIEGNEVVVTLKVPKSDCAVVAVPQSVFDYGTVTSENFLGQEIQKI